MRDTRSEVPIEALHTRDEYRDQVDLVRSRLDMLVGKDRVLMEMYWEHGHSFRDIGHVAGIGEVTMSRKIRRLTKRLIDGEYIICLRNRSRFTQMQMDIAKDYFLVGLSMKAIADKMGCSYYRVRQKLKEIEQLIGKMDGSG